MQKISLDDIYKVFSKKDVEFLKFKGDSFEIELKKFSKIQRENLDEKMQEKIENFKEETTIKKKILYEIKSPLTGIFYTSPSPDEEPYVKIGAKIEKNQPIFILEAMKNFNEVKSQVDGIVKNICVENLELVQKDQVIFEIELC